MVGIVDYGFDSKSSLALALQELEIDYKVTNDEFFITKCSHIILPDTKDIVSAIKQLNISNLFNFLRICKKPVLGISAGLKIMCDYAGEENRACLGIFPLSTNRFQENLSRNLFTLKRRENYTSPLLHNIPPESEFYFNHILDFPCNIYASACIKELDSICAIVEKDNFHAIHFCPEYSGKQGLTVINNFLNI